MTQAPRAERRRQLKQERKQRDSDEPGLELPPVELRPDEIMRVARALEPHDRMVFFALLDGASEPYLTLEEYVDRAHPGYQWGPHLRALARRLQDVADGFIRRLMVFMPPRHGKSELVSRLFTAYYLYRHPKRDVALTTYGAELSYDLSRDARTNYLQSGGELAGDSSAIKSWHTAQGGNLWATGCGGAATGRGYHLGVIDDPYKDHTEAASAIVRRGRWQWYKAVFRTRAAPGAAIVLLMTRWHMDDMAGNLLRDEAIAKQHWHVIEMPAEKRVNEISATPVDAITGAVIGPTRYVWPDTITLEPDVRDHDKWLWTQRFPVDEYESMKREQGGANGYFWNALFQQRPIASEGGMFKREWFKPITRDKLPRMRKVRWWDLGATEDDGAFTAGLEVGKSDAGDYYIIGLIHGQWHAGKRDTIIVQTAQIDGYDVTQLFPQDPGAAGKQVAQQHVRMLSGISVAKAIIESGDKELRATLPASDAANGMFYIVAEPWAAIVLQELADFGPGAEYRDIVDALSGAHAYLAGKRDRRLVTGSMSVATHGR